MIKQLLLVLAVGFCFNVEAQQMKVKVRNAYFETEKHIMTNRSYYLPDEETPSYSYNFGLDLDLTKRIYLNHLVTTEVGNAQFRHIGYNLELGYRLDFGIDIYFRHFSGHAMDFNYNKAFPQENVIGLRFHLIRY